MKIKSFLIIFVVIFAILLSSSCEKKREYDEAEVISAAEELIKKSVILNEIYYGKGIPYTTDESEADGYYYPADSVYLAEHRISTIDDLKELTAECFTEGYTESIINTKLKSITEGDTIIVNARYYQKYNSLDNSEECIMVYKNSVNYLPDTVEYDYSSLEVIGVEEESVFVKITVKITTNDGEKQQKDLTVSLIEEAAGWRIDSPTYTKYVANKNND